MDSKNNDDIESIKFDIQNLITRLSDLKRQSAAVLGEQMTKLISTMEDLQERGIEIGRDNIATLYTITRKNPFKMLLSAFALGFFISYLTKKKN